MSEISKQPTDAITASVTPPPVPQPQPAVTKPITTKVPTITIKQQRLLTRTAELDSDSTDAEVVLFEQNLKLKEAAAAVIAAAAAANATNNLAAVEIADATTNTKETTTTATTTPAAAAAAATDAITTTTTTTTATTSNSTSTSSGSAILENNKKPFKIKDVTRNIRKSLVAGTLAEMRPKVAEKFQRNLDQLPTIHLDCDGTEIDDEEYFRTLEDNTELIAVFPGEHWLDPVAYTALALDHERNSRRNSLDTKRLHKLVGQLQQNYLNDTDLESLSNMDPNSLVDITGKELFEQVRDSDYYLQSETFRTELSC